MAEAGQRFYDEEEAEQILRLASSFSPDAGKMNRQRLLDTAAELGITPEAVEMAEKQLAGQRDEQMYRAEFDQRQRSEFNSHFASYLIVCIFLVVINLLTGVRVFWAMFPILGWGLGLAIHAYYTLNRSSLEYQSRFEQWRDKRLRLDQEAESSAFHDVESNRSSLVVGVQLGGGHRSERRPRRLR